MDDPPHIDLHATLSSNERITQYLEDSLASEDPTLFLQALVDVAAVRGIKSPPYKALGSWAAVHALLHELGYEGLFVRFVAETPMVKDEDLARIDLMSSEDLKRMGDKK